MGAVSLRRVSGEPAGSEKGRSGWAGTWGTLGPKARPGPAARGRREGARRSGGRGGARRCLALPGPAPPLAGLSPVPSPFRVPIRTDFSRGPRGAQLTGRVVYGPSSPCSRRPPATRQPRCPPGRPLVLLYARPFVRASADRDPERSGRRAGRSGAQRAAPGPEIAGGSRAAVFAAGGGRALLPGRIREPPPAGAAVRELRAWKRRTHRPSACPAATPEHEPRGPAPRALSRRDPVPPRPWALRAGGAWPRRRCWWPWPRCWWAPPAICTPERVSLGVPQWAGTSAVGSGPSSKWSPTGDSEPSSVGSGWPESSLQPRGGREAADLGLCPPGLAARLPACWPRAGGTFP